MRSLFEPETKQSIVERLTALAAAEENFHRQEDSFFADFVKSSRLGMQRLRQLLDLDALRDRATQTKDTLDAAAAARLLSSVFIRSSFYESRRLLALGDTLTTLRMYAFAQSIHPEDLDLCAERHRLFQAYAAGQSVPPELSCEPASKGRAPGL